MANYTPNLQLEKPLGTEYYDIAVHNSNSDKIEGMFNDLWKIRAKLIGNETTYTDLNTIYAAGFYRSASINNLFNNLPPGCTASFNLSVENISDNNRYGKQWIGDHLTNEFWHRTNTSFTIDTPTWTAWEKVITTADVVNNLTSTSTTQPLSGNQGNVIKNRTDCMAGGEIKGYIEDGDSHLVGEVWLSRNVKGEFKCLVANTDTYIDAAKWLAIDDLTNAGKIKVLSNYKNDYVITGTYASIVLNCESYGKNVIISFDSGNHLLNKNLAPNTILAILPPEIRIKTNILVAGILVSQVEPNRPLPLFVRANGNIEFVGSNTTPTAPGAYYGQISFIMK